MAIQPIEGPTVWEELDSGKLKRCIDINNKSGYRYSCMICGKDDMVSGRSAGGHLAAHKERKTVPVTPIAKVTYDLPADTRVEIDALNAVENLCAEYEELLSENRRLKAIIADMAGLVKLA